MIKLRPAAIDQDVGRVDEAGLVGGEEQRGVGHLFRLADALAWQEFSLTTAFGFGVGRGGKTGLGNRREDQPR